MKNQITQKNVADRIPIVYVIDNFIRGGGTENQLAILIDNLDRSRFTPHVFNLRPKVMDIEIDCDVTYLDVTRLFSFKALRAIFTVARFCKASKVKILQAYFVDSRVVGTLAGRLAGVKPIVVCRREMGWRLSSFQRFAMKVTNRLAHFCLVNSNAIKTMVTAFARMSPDRIQVIYNGISLRQTQSSNPFKTEDLGIPAEVPVVGQISNLRPVKRIDRLIRIAHALKDTGAHFLIIGAGPLLEQLRSQAESLGIGDRVHFYHTVERTHDILRLFDIGVLTSESEGFSNVLVEYALAGIPTVAFDVGGNRECVVNDETGYVEQDGDENKMAERIRYLLDNPEIARRFGNRARERANQEYNVATMVNRTENFYTSIMEGSTPGNQS